MKELKDCIHLYLGSPVFDSYTNQVADLVGVNGETYYIKFGIIHERNLSEIKPILRPLESMTEQELGNIANLCYQSVFKCDLFADKITKFNESDSSVGAVIQSNENERLGLTIEIQRGIEFSIDSDKMIIPVFDLQLELYKMGIDIHGLIENNLALDSTKP